MGGLANGRRGGRAPPLLIGALIACILVLGFNYWVSSSRNLELQTKLYELEGLVRRGAAERGVAEMKKNEFQEMIRRQKEQIIHIENLYNKQLDGAQITCNEEKDTLQQNVSSSTKAIQELKGQVNQLNNDLGKLQKMLQNCQNELNTFNKKLTYDMTQCNTQILSQKELCDERVAAVKLELKKFEKLIPPPGDSSKEKVVAETVEEEGPGNVLVTTKAEPAVSHNANITESKTSLLPELLTNDIIVDKAALDNPVAPPSAKDLLKLKSVPAASTVKQETLVPPEKAVIKKEGEMIATKLLTNNLTEDKEMEVTQTHEDGPQVDKEFDLGMEDMDIGQKNENEKLISHKPKKPEHYDADDQEMVGLQLQKLQQNNQSENIDKDMEEELADYNGDDENEGEFEADKEAALSQH